jgi:hypothetical protein
MSRSSNLDLVTRYRRFESGFLQRRLMSEPWAARLPAQHTGRQGGRRSDPARAAVRPRACGSPAPGGLGSVNEE